MVKEVMKLGFTVHEAHAVGSIWRLINYSLHLCYLLELLQAVALRS